MILAVLLLHTTVYGAVSPMPGTIGIIECSVPDLQMRAAWERAYHDINLDPFLLVLNEDEVASILSEWRMEGDAVEEAWRTADRSVLDRSQHLLDEAWWAYYAFAFDKAHGFLQEADNLLASPGESRFRSGLAFETNILEGMILQAEGDGRSVDEFKRAAAGSPSTELSPGRYSPEVILEFSRARNELLSGETVFVNIDANPADADILVDGKSAELGHGKVRLPVYPGRHFVQVLAPGYEPSSRVLDAGEYDSPSLKFDLVRSGPDGEPDTFFLGRLRAGDRPYLTQLLERLDVDYVLLPEDRDGDLYIWVIGKDGRAAAQGMIWAAGEDPDSAAKNLSIILEPLRQDRIDVQQSTFSQMNLPPVPEINPDTSAKTGQKQAWKRYSVILGVLILAAAISANEGAGGGGTTMEISW